MSRCVTDLALEHYLLGERDADADHIASCPECLGAVSAKRDVGGTYMASSQAHAVIRLIATAEPVRVAPRHRRAILAVTGLALVALTAYLAWPHAAPDREAEVRAVERAWTDAIVHNDVATLDEILAPDFRLTDSTGRVTTKADNLAGMRDTRFDAYDTTELQVHVWGDTAVVTGRSVLRGTGAKGAFSRDIAFTDTLSRIDGRWRAVAAHTGAAGPDVR